jgi:hypothetical protein
MHDLEFESLKTETGEQWADICAREADIIAKRRIASEHARSTTARIRFPKEFLAVADEWAAAHQLPRSVAVRALILRGMAWEEAKHASTSPEDFSKDQQPQQLAA